MNLAVALVLAFPSPWPPQFESKDLTNQTLQRAYASHPPLRAYVRAVLAKRSPSWDSVDALVDEYVAATRRVLFVQDVASINLEEDLRYQVGLRDREVERLRLDPKANPREWKNTDGWPITHQITRLGEQLAELKDARAKSDPSGGVNKTATAVAAQVMARVHARERGAGRPPQRGRVGARQRRAMSRVDAFA